MVRLRWPRMATPRRSFGVALAAIALLAPAAAATPTATWQGQTDTLVCVDGSCRIVVPPVDDARVNVGTSTAKEVRLTLEGPKGSSLALVYDADGHRVTTPARSLQTTAWIKAPQDRVLEVVVMNIAPIPSTGVHQGVPFTLVATYR